MSTATINPWEAMKARAEEVKPWEGHHTVLCIDGEGLGRHGTLIEVLYGDDPFAAKLVKIDFGSEGVWLVQPELVTLPTDDGQHWFTTFVHCWEAGDNVFIREEAFIEVQTDLSEETG